MSKFVGKTYWLVGASEGLGRELAKELSDAGAHLVLSARNAERLDELSSALQNTRALPLDVTDLEAVRAAAGAVGEIDGVIYNAGAYVPMSTAHWDTHAAIKMCSVNYTGALHVLGECLPRFLERDKGDITLIGSLAGYRGLPAAIGYGPSKAALISLAETMRHDLKGTGIIVRIVNPGFIKTRLTNKNSFHMPMLMTPERAARHVLRTMKLRRFRTDFPAPFSWFIRLLNYLPDYIIYHGK